MTADDFLETLSLVVLDGARDGTAPFYNGIDKLKKAYSEREINAKDAQKVCEILAERYGVDPLVAESAWKTAIRRGLAAPEKDASKEDQLAYLSWVLSLEIEGFKVYKAGEDSKGQYYMQINLDGQSREVALGDVEGLMQRSKFRSAVFDQMGIRPAEVDRSGWERVLDTVARVLEQVTLDEISEGSQLKVWIIKYLKENPANNASQDFSQYIANGDPISVDGDTYINTVSFYRYLIINFREKMTLTSFGKLLGKYEFKKRRFRKGGVDMLYRLVPPAYTQEFADAGILQPGPKNSQAELKNLKRWGWETDGGDEL